MSTAGPELPPHLLAKRKRQEENQAVIPTSQRSRSSSISSTESSKKRRRILGPSLPPASLSERPSSNPESENSEDDDDFGPSLPPLLNHHDPSIEAQRQQAIIDEANVLEAAKKPQREEWMLVPPKQDDWSARADPTKLRNRKFNSGKGSKAPPQKGSGVDNALWTETPEQKRQRLEDEVMGVKKPAQLGPEEKKNKQDEDEARETARRIKEYNEKNRNTSLYSEHKKTVPKEKEDDPSKRAFDKEKDIGGGVKIGHAQKKELLNRAADFGSRFAGGNYL